jgi:hypothetical protein
MSEVKHTPGLNREQIFAIAEPYGAFEFGDAQGHKRLEFAADVIAAHERLRDAAPDLLEALILMVRTHDEPAESLLQEMKEQKWLDQARAAISKATGGAA